MQTTPGVSQWTVTSGSAGNSGSSITQQTQTQTQTSAEAGHSKGACCRHDSTDSCKSGYSLSSRYSTGGSNAQLLLLHKASRSRSVPSVARCTLCRPGLHHHHQHQHGAHSHYAHHHHQNHHYGHGSAHGGHQPQPMGMRGSESLHYTPRVTFLEPCRSGGRSGSAAESMTVAATVKNRGSLPDLRAECACAVARRHSMLRGAHCGSSGSTDSLLDEAGDLVRSCSGSSGSGLAPPPPQPRSSSGGQLVEMGGGGGPSANRRFSEDDIKRGLHRQREYRPAGRPKLTRFSLADYSPSKQSLPFLPKSAKCLKHGHLVKVITRTGRVVVGRVRYIGPLAGADYAAHETFVGLQLPSKVGDCDGSIEGRRFFEW